MSPLKLLQYNTWANRQISAIIETFTSELYDRSIGGSFGSLKATIIHLVQSDYLWLERFKGVPLADVPAWNADTPAEINKLWASFQDEMIEVGTELSITPKQPVHFITRAGKPFTLPFEEIVTHISHHGSYHRGQLTHIIRELGQKPTATDYFLFATSR